MVFNMRRLMVVNREVLNRLITTINATVGDGTINGLLFLRKRDPFVLGALEDGTPAVFMDGLYQKREYYQCKIIELIADKITTGDLNADFHV